MIFLKCEFEPSCSMDFTLHYFHLSGSLSGLRCAIARVSAVIEDGLIPDQQGRMKSLWETQHDMHYCRRQRGNPRCLNVNLNFQAADIRVIKMINYKHNGKHCSYLYLINLIIWHYKRTYNWSLQENSLFICSCTQKLLAGWKRPRQINNPPDHPPSEKRLSPSVIQTPEKTWLKLVGLSDSSLVHVVINSITSDSESVYLLVWNVSHWCTFPLTEKPNLLPNIHMMLCW